ncbi:MAG: APC family permease [Actinomycetota bacterium]|nr:APC family permease [Actinomycetota bacterium]
MKTQVVKRALLGRAMASTELEHTLLPKTIALPVFASDPLSSNAYATQEILLVLGLAGAASLTHVFPISIAVALLLATVVTSYRQTVRAYPSGGGAYRVSRENLGMYAGLFAAAALLLDYVLTVAVSITAGVDAIISAAPGLDHLKIQMTVGFIAFVTLMNLRGVRESGTLFAIPTYGFVLSIYLLLITGFVRCLGGCPVAESAGVHLEPESALTFVLILRAFAAGTTALTGVEAIADGVQAFRYPQSKNAATTLAVMGVLATSMFLGISWLADKTQVVFEEDAARTVVAQIAHAVFGGGPLFYVVQVMTAAILILAANTAYQDFPRLSSILAQDRFMPRQFLNRGDRLVFSNGVVVLAVLAALLVVVFKADLTRLIQLYLVGVFISFTLSQTGMVLRWRRLRSPGWRKSAAINAFGATVTGVVLCVVVATKFARGAWIIIVAIPVVIFIMRSIYGHYMAVAHQLADETRRPVDRRPGHQNMIIFVTRVDAAFARAVGYARAARPSSLAVVTTDPSVHTACRRVAPDVPVELLPEGKELRSRLKSYLDGRRGELSEDDFLTVVIPEILQSGNLSEILRRPGLHRLKGWLLNEPGIQVMDVPIVKEDIDPSQDQAHEPGHNYVIVLVSSVHNATLQALEYAETLRPTDLRALSFGLDPVETERLGDDWLAAGVPHPLEMDDSPFRELGRSLINYIRPFDADGLDRVVTIVLPEFVTKKRRHRILHGQTALIVKRHLLFEPGVVTVSVPYHLQD